MKVIHYMLFLTMVIAVPAVPMHKSVASACMVYGAPSKTDIQSALIQTGLVSAQMALAHPKISPIVDKTATIARKSAFVVPALVAYNSETVKNRILQGLEIAGTYFDELKNGNAVQLVQQLPVIYPQLKNMHPLLGVYPDQMVKHGQTGACSTIAHLAMDKTIQKTLYYGGIAIAGYLFYTQTLEYLSKGKLYEIFAPLKQKIGEVKDNARKNLQDTYRLHDHVAQLAKQAQNLAQRMDGYHKAVQDEHSQVAITTAELEKIQKANEQEVKQLRELLNDINIPALTDAVNKIVDNSKADKASLKNSMHQLRANILQQIKTSAEIVERAAQSHEPRAIANGMIANELSSDVEYLFTKVLELAQSIYLTSNEINQALELANKIRACTEESDSEASDSEVESDSDTDSVPRGQGSSRRA